MGRRSLGVLLASLLATAAHAQEPPKPPALPAAAARFAVEDDGTAHRPAADLPFSALASPQARKAFIDTMRFSQKQFAGPAPDLATMRQRADQALGLLLARSRARYPVTITRQTLGGVPVDVVAPQDGVAPDNAGRVLINLHGGGFFTGGGGIGGQVEAVPIAGVGRIKVVSVDYRQGPEHRFPAASQDVAAVYQALLKDHRPDQIGIYGCSAGGLLTAEAVAWLAKAGLPRPGAVGVFCASAGGWAGGDSGYGVGARPSLTPGDAVSNSAYFAGADLADPLVLPLASDAVMAAFPPTLVITGTRDSSMSVAVHTHAVLTRLGVEADLHVWEGLGHGFFYDPATPEAQEAYVVITRFFARRLGR